MAKFGTDSIWKTYSTAIVEYSGTFFWPKCLPTVRIFSKTQQSYNFVILFIAGSKLCEYQNQNVVKWKQNGGASSKGWASLNTTHHSLAC